MSRSFRVNMSCPELGKAIDQISAYDGKTALRVENAIQSGAKNIASGAKRRVPVKSGGLKKSIVSRFGRNKYGRGVIEAEVAARKPHAHLVEFGARATVVKPKTKKALRIIDKGMFEGTGGQFGASFAERATIPRRAAHPYMRPAFENEKPALIRAVQEAVKP